MTRTRDENEGISEQTVQQFPLMEKGHPRLYLTRANIPALLAKADSESETPFGVSGKQLWSALQATAESYLLEMEVTIPYYGGHTVTYSFPPQQPPTMDNPPGHTVTRYPYWTGYASALKERLQLLSTAHLVTGREDFAVKALSYMKALAEWENWTDPSYNCGGESCAEGYGLYTRVSGGTPAEACQFLTVLRAEADIRPGIFPGDSLMPPYGASGSMQRFTRRSGNDWPGYRASGAGDYISAEFEVPVDGCYRIQTLFYQSPDSGQVRIYIDGQPLGEIFEGYDADRRAAPPFDHGRLELSAGRHYVRYEITGRHELAGRFDLLIDELRVLPCDIDPLEDENRRDTLSARKLSGDGAIGVLLSSWIKPGTHSLVVFRLSASEPGTAYSIDQLASDAEQAIVELDGSGAVTGYAATRASKLTFGGRTLLEAERALHAAVRCDPVHGGLLIELELEAADNVTLYAAGGGRLPEAAGGRAADSKQRMKRLEPETEGLVSIDLPAGQHVFGTIL